MVRRAMRVSCVAAVLVLGIAAFGPAAALAGPYSRLQILVPGESAAPGTTTGKTGTPNRQTANVPFTVTVRACDSGWNLVPTMTNAVEILASDASATLPPPVQLVGGTATYSVTFNAGGTFTVFAHDQTDNTIPDGASAPVQSLVLQGFQFATISQKHKYAGVPDGTVITAIDPSGATVTGFSGQVHLREITSFGDGRITPEYVTFSNGQWSGNVTMYRADESSINRGNVNMYAFLDAAPQKNGTSDPFIVHPGPLARVQLVVPGESPLPGSVSGKIGSPATQGAGRAFVVSVWSTDAYWNPVLSANTVQITSTDPNDNMPQSGALTNGFRQFNASLGTVGTQTISVSSSGLQGMTSPPIQVIPSDVDHFVVSTITSPQIAGVPVSVTIRATDSNGNTIPAYAGDAVLVANTGAGSIVPEFVTFTAGVWTGPMVFKGAGGAVSFAVADFSAPPHIGSSNSFTVNPGPFSGVQVLLPGQSPRGGTADGKEGNPTPQQAGTPFTLTVRAVDDYWNLVSGVADSIALGSSDANAGMPARTRFTGGQALLPVTLYRTGSQRIWASDITTPTIRPDTSSAVMVSGGPFARVLVLAPGEFPAPGTPSGRGGAATAQSSGYSFNVTVLATDTWWNPVGGVSDVVRITSDDTDAELPNDTTLVDGRVEMSVRLKRNGYNLITVSDVSRPSIPGSQTQVETIGSGFHLRASITPATARAGEPFTLWVRVTNQAGSIIQEVNSAVTLEVRNAATPPPGTPGRGQLVPTQIQLQQGQKTVLMTYTFVEPIYIIARDNAGNDPATSNSITITPGLPDSIRMDAPTWVGGNTQTRVTATLMDEFGNGVPGEEMVFSVLTGSGTISRLDSLTVGDGSSRADYQSPRFPEMGRIRASSAGVVSDWNIETAFVDPNAAGGHVTNYPNPFHPPNEPTTIAYKLSDNATVTMRIFTLSGDLVLRRIYERSTPGGLAGLNEVTWDGRNGENRVVASGGYIVLIEAQGTGETLHVIRRKIAVVR